MYFKLLNKDGNLGFQDFIIDKISGKQPVQKSSPVQKFTPIEPIIPKEEKVHTDVLANIVSAPQSLSIPDANMIVPPEETYVAPTESNIPDWLKESTNLQSLPVSSETTTDDISIPENIISEESIAVSSLESNEKEKIDNPILITEDIASPIPEENIDTSSESSMPDWLKGT